MKTLYLLLLMAQFLAASRNFNSLLDRDGWISLAKESIKNHKPYKWKTYEPYKPRVVNFTNPFAGDLWETIFENPTTVAPTETTYSEGITSTTTESYETTEDTDAYLLDSTTPVPDFTSTTPTNFEVTTTSSDSITESDEEYLETTTEFMDATTETNPLLDTTTEFVGTTTENPETTTVFYNFEPAESTTTEADLSTTTEVVLSTTENPEIFTSLLEIIATTPGFETTTSYLDLVLESTEASNSDLQTSKLNLTETAQPVQLVDEIKKEVPRKYTYNSDTEPEMYWN